MAEQGSGGGPGPAGGEHASGDGAMHAAGSGIAPPGHVRTRYGAPLTDALREQVSAIKCDDPMAPVTVIAPSNVAALSMRRALAAGVGGRAGVAALTVTTFAGASALAGAPAGQRKALSSPVLRAVIRRELAADPGVFAPVADNAHTVEALASVYEQLRESDAAEDEATFAVIGESELGSEVLRVRSAVRAATSAEWEDGVDVLLSAAARIDAGDAPVARFGHVILAGVGEPSPAEAVLVRALVRARPVTCLAARTGDPRADDAAARSLRRGGMDTDAGPEAASGPGDASPPVAQEVIHASDPDDEVRTVVRSIMRDLQDTDGHRIAVFYAAGAPYARLLHAHLDSAGIGWNGPGSRTYSTRAVARFLLGLLALPAADFARDELIGLLSGAPITGFDGTRVPVVRWDRAARESGVVRGGDWDGRLAAGAARLRAEADAAEEDGTADDGTAGDGPGRAGRAERLRAMAADAEGLGAFVGRLRREFADAEEYDHWADLRDWARDLWRMLLDGQEGRKALPPEERAAAGAVEAAFEQVDQIAAYEGPPTVARLREILRTVLDGDAPRVGSFGTGVFVGPVSEARGLDVRRAYVLGLSEDLYPGRTGEDPLLPDAVRERLGGSLPTAQDRITRLHAHLLAAFAAGGHTVASFSRGSLGAAGERLPSRWLLPTLSALASDGVRRVHATRWLDHEYTSVHAAPSFARNLAAAEHPAAPQEWRVRAAAAGVLDDPVATRAAEMIASRSRHRFTRFDGNLAGQAGLPDFADGHATVSPTQLETYTDCPYAFFVKHLLHVRPREDPARSQAITALDIGNLIHHAVDDLISSPGPDGLPAAGEPWSEDHRRRLLAYFDEHARALQATGATGHETLWRRTRRELERRLLEYLDRDAAWRAAKGLSVRASELRFGYPGTPAADVPLADGRAVRMRGSADRVDTAQDGSIYVTDLKTGSAKSFAGISEDDPTAAGAKLQLPVYAHAARAALSAPDAQVVTQYWFVRENDEERMITAVPLSAEVEHAYAEALGVIVGAIAAGNYPARPPEGADHGFVRCEYCNPDGAGYGQAPGRWRRKRGAPQLAGYVDLIGEESR